MIRRDFKLTGILALLLNIVFQVGGIAQTADEVYNDNKRHPEVGLNITSLVSQFVILNNSDLRNFQLFDYQYKTMKNGHGLRFGLGVLINSNNFTSNHFNFRIGYERRKPIRNSRFLFTRGIDMTLLIDDSAFSGVVPANELTGFNGLGGDVTAGFEYMLFPNITIGTEAILIAVIGDGLDIRLIPPLAVNVSFRL